MVFGNRDDNSGTGVGFTRNPATGENRPYGDFLVNAQGEDVVAGIRNTETSTRWRSTFPKIHEELLAIFDRLEKHYRDMCDTEFTIEQGKLWMLQTRVGKRTGAAALRMAVEMTEAERPGWKITESEAVERVDRRAPRPGAAPAVRRQGERKVIAKGLAASPGAAVGPVPTSPPTTPPTPPTAARRSSSCATRRQPEDVHGMQVVRGHPHRPGRAREPRRRRRPRLGHPRRRRRRGGQDRRQVVHRRRRHRERGRRHLARRHDRRGRARRGRR